MSDIRDRERGASKANKAAGTNQEARWSAASITRNIGAIANAIAAASEGIRRLGLSLLQAFTIAVTILALVAVYLSNIWILLGAALLLSAVVILITVGARFFPESFAAIAVEVRRHIGYLEVPGLPAVFSFWTIIIGIVLGTVFYVKTVYEAQQGLLAAAESTNVLQRVIDESPQYASTRQDPTITRLAVLLLLQRLNLLPSDATPQDVFDSADSRFRLLVAALKGEGGKCGSGASMNLKTTTAEMIVGLAIYLGCAKGTDGAEVLRTLPAVLTGVVVRRQGGWDKVRNELKKGASSGTWVLFSRPDPVPDRRLLSAVYGEVAAKSDPNAKLYDIVKAYVEPLGQLEDSNARQAQGRMPEDVQLLIDVQLGLLAEIHRDAAVAEKRSEVDIWLGYEQFALVVLAFTLAAILFVRWIYAFPNLVMAWYIFSSVVAAKNKSKSGFQSKIERSGSLSDIKDQADKLFQQKNQHLAGPLWLLDGAYDDLKATGQGNSRSERLQALLLALEESRTGLVWAYGALPAVGFLGTVHGILSALGNSSAITSTDRLEQAAGIAQVSGALGLAFSTTLIALAASLFLGFLDMLLHRCERSSIRELNRKLVLEYLS